jgi:hypothetical protein
MQRVALRLDQDVQAENRLQSSAVREQTRSTASSARWKRTVANVVFPESIVAGRGRT